MKKINKDLLAQAIERRIEKDLELCNVMGASVLVAQSGEIIYKKHFYTEGSCGKAVTDDTLFRLASMTKPISAVAAMILVDRGLLSLHDTVDCFYPKFSSLTVLENGIEKITDSKITIKDLLTHTSGIACGETWQRAYKKIRPADIESVEAFVDFVSEQPISFIPGTKYEYSGIGAFSVLTGIIQKITGMPYELFLKKEIFEPCKMKDTTFIPNEQQWERTIDMHDKVNGKNCMGKTYSGCVFENIPTHNYLGGAGLLSSMSDYLNFAEMLLNGGNFEGNRIISEKAVAEISMPQYRKRIEEAWGLGVRVITDEKYNSLPVGAYGWSGAYGTHFFIDPENQIIGIYMKNSKYDGGSGAVTSKNFEVDVYSSLK